MRSQRLLQPKRQLFLIFRSNCAHEWPAFTIAPVSAKKCVTFFFEQKTCCRECPVRVCEHTSKIYDFAAVEHLLALTHIPLSHGCLWCFLYVEHYADHGTSHSWSRSYHYGRACCWCTIQWFDVSVKKDEKQEGGFIIVDERKEVDHKQR